MKNLTIHSLRKDLKYKVRVNHFRMVRQPQCSHLFAGQEYPLRIFKDAKLQELIDSKGGRTLIEITDTKGNNYSFEAKCSNKDSFNRKIGISICLGRLGQKLEQIQEIEKNS